MGKMDDAVQHEDDLIYAPGGPEADEQMERFDKELDEFLGPDAPVSAEDRMPQDQAQRGAGARLRCFGSFYLWVPLWCGAHRISS